MGILLPDAERVWGFGCGFTHDELGWEVRRRAQERRGGEQGTEGRIGGGTGREGRDDVVERSGKEGWIA